MKKIGRNDPCACGSGRKYKHCCYAQGRTSAGGARDEMAAVREALQHAVQFQRAGRLPEAEFRYQQVLEINPALSAADLAGVHYNLGIVLQDQGRLEEAVASYRRALGIQPRLVECQGNLASALKVLGRFEEAAAAYRAALALAPGDALLLYSLGTVLRDLGKLDEAAAALRQALARNANDPDAHLCLGLVLSDQHELSAAAASFRAALLLKPDWVPALLGLGNALRDLGKPEEAIACYRKAPVHDPQSMPVLINLGVLLRDLRRFDEAVATYRTALRLDPDSVYLYMNLGLVLRNQGNLEEAAASYRKAVERQPDLLDAWKGLAAVLQELGKIDETLAAFRAALAIEPSSAEIYSALLATASYHCRFDPRKYLDLARGWERAVMPEFERNTARLRVLRSSPLAGRRLKLGYVSGDFRQHAVSYFIEQIFRHHDRGRIELFAYSNFGWEDDVTARIRSHTDHWVRIEKLSDAAVREKIETDRIDVLVDLSGHTALNRMGVLARRAAPVQVEYLGGVGSTGLTEVDYWLGDAIVTPPETDAQFSERVWRLPRAWVSYNGSAEAPRPAPREEPDGALWVGSFANLSKLTMESLRLWARLLQALPEGRLLLKTKGLDDPRVREPILGTLAAHGAAPERVELLDSKATPSWAAHMGSYHRLDVALDPVEVHTGATTTCDALWMGVPVVTKLGNRMGWRMTASSLHALGHPEWIVQSDDEYIEKAVALARDAGLRRELRLSLRGAMARSPLCDARDLAACLEDAYAAMYQRWLERQAVEAS